MLRCFDRDSRRLDILVRVSLSLIIVCAFSLQFVQAVSAQIPTVNIPTVTGTDPGVIITVNNDEANPQINVRAGPGTEYDRVGTLLANQQVIGKGRTEGGGWLLIEYPGGPDGVAWVYRNYVTYVGDLPIVVVPPTPTPRITNTMDPTLAAQFIVEQLPTRLATFTAPPELVLPTFESASGTTGNSTIPMGMIIVACGILGIIILLFTIAQRQ